VKLRQFLTLDDFLENIHQEGCGILEYEGNKIPCIYVQQPFYDDLLKKSLGKKYVVDSLLNIFYDGHHVFVDVQLEFINLGMEANFLISANSSIEFFNALSSSGLLAIIPHNNVNPNTSNIFMIQLPNKEKIMKGVEIIKKNLGIKKNNEKETI
jgi:hypothetical protein